MKFVPMERAQTMHMDIWLSDNYNAWHNGRNLGWKKKEI
jgi:hypothetical protein